MGCLVDDLTCEPLVRGGCGFAEVVYSLRRDKVARANIASMDIASITALMEDHLSKATTADSGRSSVTVYGRSGARLRQTVIALAAGRFIGEHKSPGDASVFCLQGRVRLHAGELQTELETGDFIAVPPQRHDLEAVEPSVLLLTVALH